MKILHSTHPNDVKEFSTAKLRERFHQPSSFNADEINLVYTHYDRFIFGYITPKSKKLELPTYEQLKSDFFHERRESGILNIGGTGTITVDGEAFELDKEEILYIGKGKKSVTLESKDASNPALFYINSAPAHHEYPTTKGTKSDANRVELGEKESCNERVIYQYIHENGIQSCQLVMGYTQLNTGSIWNTFPPHTHDRRMEVYLYFDIPEEHIVMHFMGEGSETRHIVMKNHDAVVSPPWSIHAGAGTMAYKFIWGMAGENKSFTDMDGIKLTELL